ncbi:GDSL esterase/lipase 1-like [Senna tora]|uniref:GDSL esterase/lipase 1-like n=1 Tax=Senna tora TaxID=362788 RepID=A0A835CM36_9FABA|nr:GDSL esterase/lipase 1-like [Senna tora]
MPSISVTIGMSGAFEWCAAKFFGHFIFGEDYFARKTRSKNIFKATLKWLVEAGIHTFNLHTLAHALQNLGNKAFNLKYYFTSDEYYSYAFALFQDNIGFLCDRPSDGRLITDYIDEKEKACCGSGKNNGELTCGNIIGKDQVNVCDINSNELQNYLWFDALHPTSLVHEEFVDQIWNKKKYVVSNTLKQLYDEQYDDDHHDPDDPVPIM